MNILTVLFSILYAPAFIPSSPPVTTVIITHLNLRIQPENTPDFIFPGYFRKDTGDTLHFYSEFPFRLVCSTLDEYKRPTYTTFLLQPGETVRIKNEAGKAQAFSPDRIRNNELNFFTDLQAATGNFEGLLTYIPHKRKNADSLLHAVTTLYQKRLDFLENYIAQNPVSPGFENRLKKIIRYRQYYDFLDNCRVDQIFQPALLSNPRVSSFLNGLLQEEEDPDSIYYLEALFSMLWLTGQKEDITAFYNTINNTYTGKTRDYLVYKTVENTYKNTDLSIQLVDKFLATAKSDPLKESITTRYEEYVGYSTDEDFKVIKPDYDYTKTSLLYHLKSGKIITWDSLLATAGHKYIDFWATWCGGCREGIPHSLEIGRKYKSKGLKVVYISKDTNPKIWRKISRKENLPDEDSYLLLDPGKTFIDVKYGIYAIPRYMLVNNQGIITHPEAPRSNNSALENALNEALK